MQLNATLIGQMISFGIFVWFTMRFIWPVLIKQLDERKKKIADGLAAAEAGQQLLSNTQAKTEAMLQEAKMQCAKLLQDAQNEAVHHGQHHKYESLNRYN